MIAVARPRDSGMKNAVYNEHQRKHASKFHAIVSFIGMSLHQIGLLEGRRHIWILFSRSGVDERLASILEYGGMQYFRYGYRGYNSRLYVEIPFQSTPLSDGKRAFNESMLIARMTVKWMLKELKLC